MAQGIITLTTHIKTRTVNELNETGSIYTQGNLMTDSERNSNLGDYLGCN